MITIGLFIKRWLGHVTDARVFIDLEDLLSQAYSAGRERGMADAKTLLEPNPPAGDLDISENEEES